MGSVGGKKKIELGQKDLASQKSKRPKGRTVIKKKIKEEKGKLSWVRGSARILKLFWKYSKTIQCMARFLYLVNYLPWESVSLRIVIIISLHFLFLQVIKQLPYSDWTPRRVLCRASPPDGCTYCCWPSPPPCTHHTPHLWCRCGQARDAE